ncbi:MAG TPA: SMC-Scp complex subunit ScpB [Xanthomonadales bacterium]|nr:SMC-Scp complex subunit ScpB [Xanthomonadales bacterium]
MSDNQRTDALVPIIEALLLTAGQPLDLKQIAAVFDEAERPTAGEIGAALNQLGEDCEGRGIELSEVASGFRLQVREECMSWVSRLWEERPQRYSRALLETLALIAYRQPITRGDIEDVRGVSVSTNIIRTLQEREWIRVVGHRDVPGKPALFGTTKAFLDYFDLSSLDDLPTLAEIKDLGSLEPELEFDSANDDESPGEPGEAQEESTEESEQVESSDSDTETKQDPDAEPADETEDETEVDAGTEAEVESQSESKAV